LPYFSEQIFRRIACLNPAFVNDNDPAACHFDLRQNVSREQNRVLFAKTLDELAYLPDLI
jgi:hypothetical protein